MKRLQTAVVSILGILLILTIVQSVVPKQYVPEEPEEMEPCVGQPIFVDFEYNGMVNEPWSCEEQCNDHQPRYILYSNNRATQCETPPGCNDYGEDRGVTCEPQIAS